MTETTLKNKQQAFIDAYLKTFNATKAAKEAGYSEKTAYSIGSELLKKPEIKEAIRTRMSENAMDANEVLYHLAEIARGDVDDVVNEYGNLDMTLARENGKTRLLKTLRNRAITTENATTYETEVGMYDRMRALELIGKHLAMFTDKVETVTWETRAVDDIRAGRVTYKELVSLFDETLADTLFKQAGVPIER